MTYAISVEELSKKFRLHHQAGGSTYSTFRDAFAQGVQQLGRSLLKRSLDADGTDEEFWALRQVSFQVAQGEKIGIIGRNGAGKSTLLKVISRIIPPTAGRVRISGRVASLLEVGTGFHPELTGRENIFFNGAILGMSRVEICRRFDEIVAFAEVEKFLDTPVKHFSSGMYVRLGFAVAAHLEPEILIIDEVLAVGDARFQKKCLSKLQDIGSEGRTILYVSHNMNSVLQFTDRVVLLHGGRILYDCDSETGVREYFRVNAQDIQDLRLASKVPWFRVEELVLDQENMKLGFNVPLRFKLSATSERNLEEMELVLFFNNSIGARILTARTVVYAITEGRHVFSIEISDHRLIPGTYLASMIVREMDLVIFLKEQFIAFELVADEIEDPILQPLIARGSDRFGCYCPISVVN